MCIRDRSTTGLNFPEKILSAKVEETGSDKLGIDSKKRMNDSSSGESSDDGSSDSEAESKKKPRLVASIPSLLRRSQSPISAIVSTAKNIVADAAVVPQQAKTPAKAFPSFNDWVASKPPVGPGATAILNRSPSAFGPEKTTVRKPILSSLEDLATRGVPDVKESTTKESTHGTSATKKNVFEDDDDSDEDETSSDDDGSDDDFSDESGVNDGSEKFLSMKKAVARKNTVSYTHLDVYKRQALGTQTTEYSVIPNLNPHAGLESGVSQLHSNNNNSSNNTSNNNKATVEQVSNGILLENSRPSGSPPAAQVAAPRVSHPIPTSSFFSNLTPTTYNESEVIDSKVNTYGSPSTSATSTIATQPVEHKNGSTLSNLVHQGERDATVHNLSLIHI